jgi:hypothetical protein
LITQLETKKLKYDPQEYDELQRKLDIKRRKASVFIVKDCLDLIVAFKMSGSAKFVGLNISEGLIGLVGAASGFISLHHLLNVNR